jgi:hypothetical protein
VGLEKQELDKRERKRNYALQNHAENEKGFVKYIDLVKSGVPEYEAREKIKGLFHWGDRRLDRVLDTRAGVYSPGMASMLEAKAMVYIQRIDRDIMALRRFYDRQLDDLDVAIESGNEWFDVKEVDVTRAGEVFERKTERIPIAEAEQKILNNRLNTNKILFDALKALKADTVINLNTDDMSQYSDEQLDIGLRAAKGKLSRKIEDAEFTIEETGDN